MPDNKNLLNLDDLADVFAQLNDIEDAPEEPVSYTHLTLPTNSRV